MKPILVDNPAAVVGPWAIAPLHAQYLATRFDRLAGLLAPMLAADPTRIEARGRAEGDQGKRSYSLPVEDGVAYLPLHGPLLYAHSFWDRLFARWFEYELPPTLGELEEAVRAVIGDTRVHTLAVLADSPGGHVTGTGPLADAVWDARQSGMRTAGFAEGMVASAAVWVFGQCEETAITPEAQAGSVGTRFSIVDSSVAREMRGHKVINIASTELKGAGTPGTEITAAMIEDWARIIEQTNELFIEGLARGRQVSVEHVASTWADARVHVGRHAVKEGLVGRVVSRRDFERALASGDALDAIDSKRSTVAVASLSTGADDATATPAASETAPAPDASTDDPEPVVEGVADEPEAPRRPMSRQEAREHLTDLARTDPKALRALVTRRRQALDRQAGHFSKT